MPCYIHAFIISFDAIAVKTRRNDTELIGVSGFSIVSRACNDLGGLFKSLSDKY